MPFHHFSDDVLLPASACSIILTIGPFQLAIHMVQKCRAGEQKSHWEKTNKENYHFKYVCLLFVLCEYDFCSPAWQFCTM